MPNTGSPDHGEQHSVVRSLTLHLLPGALIIAFYILAAPIVIGLGFPAGFTLLLGFVLVGMPFQLRLLLHQGKKRNGTFSLRGIVLYREPMPVWQYVAFFFLLLVLAFSVLFLTSPVSRFLAERVFSWLPAYLLPDGELLRLAPARTAILVTLVAGLVVDGILNPVVEEL